jgi:anti-sigma factor (TIGR02949 family)
MSKHDTEHEDIGCLEAIEALYAWLDGELDQTAVTGFEQHLSHCRSCYSRAEMEKALTERIRTAGGSKASDGLKIRLRKLMDDI